jgi:SAM-dependent methyltransferase
MDKKKFSLGLWGRLQPQTQKRLMRIRRPLWFGTLRSTNPVSAAWGKDRGSPVDRYYIEQFLQTYCEDIQGRVLEVGTPAYTRRFGKRVAQSDVLDSNLTNPSATILNDLDSTINVGSNEFDCLIFTQVLQFIYNLQNCIQELHRILKPGGVLLVTVPCISKVDPGYEKNKDFWRFTDSGCKMLFGDVFGSNQVKVHIYGNVLSSIAFLTGAAYEELSQTELDHCDPSFQLLLGVRAVKG